MRILDGVVAQVAQAINGANMFYDGAFIRVRGVPDGRGGFTQYVDNNALIQALTSNSIKTRAALRLEFRRA